MPTASDKSIPSMLDDWLRMQNMIVSQHLQSSSSLMVRWEMLETIR
jgi:hypothetical protein